MIIVSVCVHMYSLYILPWDLFGLKSVIFLFYQKLTGRRCWRRLDGSFTPNPELCIVIIIALSVILALNMCLAFSELHVLSCWLHFVPSLSGYSSLSKVEQYEQETASMTPFPLASAGSDVKLVGAIGMCNHVTEQITGRCYQSAVLCKSTSQQGLHTTHASPCIFPSLIGIWRSLSRSFTSTGVVCLTSEAPQYNLPLLLKWDLSLYFLELLCHHTIERGVVFYTTLMGRVGFPGGSEVKDPPANAGDAGVIPALGRSPGGGNGNPFQYSCLENSMNRGAWWATVHRLAESVMTEWVCVCMHVCAHTHTMGRVGHCYSTVHVQ